MAARGHKQTSYFSIWSLVSVKHMNVISEKRNIDGQYDVFSRLSKYNFNMKNTWWHNELHDSNTEYHAKELGCLFSNAIESEYWLSLFRGRFPPIYSAYPPLRKCIFVRTILLITTIQLTSLVKVCR